MDEIKLAENYVGKRIHHIPTKMVGMVLGAALPSAKTPTLQLYVDFYGGTEWVQAEDCYVHHDKQDCCTGKVEIEVSEGPDQTSLDNIHDMLAVICYQLTRIADTLHVKL